MTFKKGELRLGSSGYHFTTTKQFFRHYNKPDCIFLQLIDDYLNRNKVKKKVFLIYDYDEAEFALCIVPTDLFEQLIYSLSKLKALNEQGSSGRLDYLLKRPTRVIEFTGIIDNSPYRLDIIIRDEN